MGFEVERVQKESGPLAMRVVRRLAVSIFGSSFWHRHSPICGGSWIIGRSSLSKTAALMRLTKDLSQLCILPSVFRTV